MKTRIKDYKYSFLEEKHLSINVFFCLLFVCCCCSFIGIHAIDVDQTLLYYDDRLNSGY